MSIATCLAQSPPAGWDLLVPSGHTMCQHDMMLVPSEASVGDWVKVDPPSYEEEENKSFPCPNATFENFSTSPATIPAWSQPFSMDFYVNGSTSTAPPWSLHFMPYDPQGKNTFDALGPVDTTPLAPHYGYKAFANFLWVYGIQKWVKTDPVEAHEREMSKYFYGGVTEVRYPLPQDPPGGGVG